MCHFKKVVCGGNGKKNRYYTFWSKKIAFAISRNHVLLDTRGGGRRESTLPVIYLKNKSFEDFVNVVRDEKP